MKIKLRRGPNVLGVTTGAEVDTNSLAPVEAQELEQLVKNADLELDSGNASPLTPDQQELVIQVEDGEQRIQASFSEGQTPPRLDQLLEYLDQHTKVIPAELDSNIGDKK